MTGRRPAVLAKLHTKRGETSSGARSKVERDDYAIIQRNLTPHGTWEECERCSKADEAKCTHLASSRCSRAPRVSSALSARCPGPFCFQERERMTRERGRKRIRTTARTRIKMEETIHQSVTNSSVAWHVPHVAESRGKNVKNTVYAHTAHTYMR